LGILLQQLRATMVLVLVAAAALAAALGDVKNTVAVGAIVVLFVLLGTLQEYRAEKAIAALKRLAVRGVSVKRDGRALEIPARDLVPGDLVLLEAGDLVPADVRLAEAAGLRIQEAALTGESEPITKRVEASRNKTSRWAIAATWPTWARWSPGPRGRPGRGHRHAHRARQDRRPLQQTVEGLTPLQRRLDRVGKALALAGLAVAALVFASACYGTTPCATCCSPRCRWPWPWCPRDCRLWSRSPSPSGRSGC